jgi:hypothetical protein
MCDGYTLGSTEFVGGIGEAVKGALAATMGGAVRGWDRSNLFLLDDIWPPIDHILVCSAVSIDQT